eukprot:13284-Eustigmatos_ZCMA.PRE.1
MGEPIVMHPVKRALYASHHSRGIGVGSGLVTGLVTAAAYSVLVLNGAFLYHKSHQTNVSSS